MNSKTSTNWDKEILDIYFQEIASSEPLSSKEEVELAPKIRNGCEQSRNELVSANLRFVVKVATEYQNCGLPLEDLISAGNMGLINAAERFDETRGFKFITYAHWWIRQAIYNSLSQDARMVRLPANRIKLLNNITKLMKRLGQSQSSQPDPRTLSRELGVSEEMIEDTLMRAQEVCSLDSPTSEDEECAPLNLVFDSDQAMPDAHISEVSDREQIHSALETLEEREARVLRLHFGLEDDHPRTLAKVGKILELTKERVRQIKEKALGKLRHPQRRAYLEPLREPI